MLGNGIWFMALAWLQLLWNFLSFGWSDNNAAVAERIMRRTSKPFHAGSIPVSCTKLRRMRNSRMYKYLAPKKIHVRIDCQPTKQNYSNNYGITQHLFMPLWTNGSVVALSRLRRGFNSHQRCQVDVWASRESKPEDRVNLMMAETEHNNYGNSRLQFTIDHDRQNSERRRLKWVGFFCV